MLIGMLGVQKYTIYWLKHLNEKPLNGMGHPKIAAKNKNNLLTLNSFQTGVTFFCETCKIFCPYNGSQY